MPPINRTFDRIVIAVPDLALAIEQYAVFFGTAAVAVPASDDCNRAWLALDNTVLELLERPLEKSRVLGLVLANTAAPEQPRVLANDRNLQLLECDGRATERFRQDHPQKPQYIDRVDHLVLKTADGDACVALFRDRLGIRLALDQTVPEWGGRMLFFRAGSLTLEVIASPGDEARPDYFWGIALQCADLETAARALKDRGVAASDIRDGRKPGTRVLSPKSHVLDIPTLLVEPAAARASVTVDS